MKTPPLFLLAVLCAAFAAAQAPSIRASSSQEMQTKVALEGLLENRLETVLRKMLGSEEVFVIANADIATDADRPESEVLPGVMIKKTLSSPAPLELPASLVKRVSLAIYMGRSMSDEDVESARKTAERMIGFKPERGDAVSVERLGAPREAKAPPPSASWLERALEPRNILLLAGLLTAFAALLFVTRKFFEPFLQVLREAVSGLSAARSAPAAEAAARAERTEPDEDRLAAPAPAPAPAAARVDAQGQERKLPFAFVTEKDLPALAMLIPDSADLAAAMVVQYLQPALASKFLGAMSPLRREKVLGYMGKAVLIDQAGVRELEESVLSRIDYIMGGEEKLVSLLDSSSTGLQAEMLATLEQQDPELGQRLKRRVVLLDDIALLDETGLGVLSRQVSVRSMAVVLKHMPQLQECVLPKLKGGLGEWLAQEISLVAELPEAVKEQELRRVLQALVGLVREGRIALHKE